jgi:hypothetical protein
MPDELSPRNRAVLAFLRALRSRPPFASARRPCPACQESWHPSRSIVGLMGEGSKVSLFGSGAAIRKKPGLAIPLGPVAAGVRDRGKGGDDTRCASFRFLERGKPVHGPPGQPPVPRLSPQGFAVWAGDYVASGLAGACCPIAGVALFVAFAATHRTRHCRYSRGAVPTAGAVCPNCSLANPRPRKTTRELRKALRSWQISGSTAGMATCVAR